MAKPEAPGLHRRRFLKGMVAAGGATMAAPPTVQAQTSQPPKANAPTPTATTQAKEREHPPEMERLTTEKTGSDFMVDVCKTLDLDYMASCPGSTFRGLQESFIN
jgi:acetolactate synthase-1/2/3 large subunit